ncbi:hypothetical protein K438DRAFT_1658734 [Mycena galopus ATCC 62051]|nr:hypothetical protein K438DRAFT_1658734 [Mycena galopus ATCC 62051]
MLLLLLLMHVFSQNSSAAPPSHPFDAQLSTDSCDDINNCRQLFGIVWGCLATIFACTWVSVHPNVPPPDQSWLALFWRRLKMMLIGILVPEIMAGFAVRQFLGAWMLSREYGFSKTLGFFFIMGGFVSSTGYPIATEKQLRDPTLGPEFQETIKAVNVEDIMDKSKGDALSKGVALAQGLWFITQCVARVHQHLAMTELEVATLGFAVMNIFIWLLWWNKPLDVQRPIVITSPEHISTQPTSPARVSRRERFSYAIYGVYSGHNYEPLSSTSVPSFWTLPVEDLRPLLFTIFIGTLLGAIHCAAWNTDYLSTVEMWMWRVCSLAITTVPSLIAFSIFGGTHTSARTILDLVVIGANAIMMFSGILIYIAARLILIVLPLIALRSLPPSAFLDVNWSVYIPHI